MQLDRRPAMATRTLFRCPAGPFPNRTQHFFALPERSPFWTPATAGAWLQADDPAAGARAVDDDRARLGGLGRAQVADGVIHFDLEVEARRNVGGHRPDKSPCVFN